MNAIRGAWVQNSLHWVLVPSLSDNYILLIHNLKTQELICFDPGSWDPLNAFLSSLDHPSVTHVFLTHPHQDHIGGLAPLRSAHSCELFSGADTRLTTLGARPLLDHESINVWNRFKVTAIETPGHTVPALCFLIEATHSFEDDTPKPILFAGDTLFVGGCGRLFEGGASMMWSSLLKLRSQVPTDSLFFCAHEYTTKNLEFLKELIPAWKTEDILNRLDETRRMREHTGASIPQLWTQELIYNPFLNAEDPALAQAMGLSPASDPTEVFSKLRKLRNIY